MRTLGVAEGPVAREAVPEAPLRHWLLARSGRVWAEGTAGPR